MTNQHEAVSPSPYVRARRKRVAAEIKKLVRTNAINENNNIYIILILLLKTMYSKCVCVCIYKIYTTLSAESSGPGIIPKTIIHIHTHTCIYYYNNNVSEN